VCAFFRKRPVENSPLLGVRVAADGKRRKLMDAAWPDRVEAGRNKKSVHPGNRLGGLVAGWAANQWRRRNSRDQLRH